MQISARDLGTLKLADFCPRCFWIKRHQKKLPYQKFPGIFSSIDSYTKSMVEHYFNRNGRLPDWLSEIGEVASVVKKPKDFYVEKQDVKLTGVPDVMFRRNDNGIIIADYKTARYTEGQDELLPSYEVQLNVYAYIAEHVGLEPVHSLYLIYFEPPEKVKHEELSKKHTSSEGFELPFTSSIHKIKKDGSEIEALMLKAHEIYSMNKPPESLEGCEDCKNANELANLISL
jgi:hypothetical protein